MRSNIFGGTSTAAPNFSGNMLTPFSFQGAIEIQALPSPKSEDSGEVKNKIDFEETEKEEILVKRRISSWLTTVASEYGGHLSKR